VLGTVAGGAAASAVVAAAAAASRGRARTGPSGTARLGRVVTVERPVDEVYAFWRDLPDLPRVLPHLERVDVLDERRSRWVATAPTGVVEWEAEIVDDQPGRRLAWRSLPGAQVPNEGEVTFTPAPGDRGTELRVALSYSPPVGGLGRAVARIVGEEPDRQVLDALRRAKQVLECGEAVRADERVSARGPVQSWLTRQVRRQLSSGGRP
jgi:uncharacterized membrane protein